jgi:hypothetical protein
MKANQITACWVVILCTAILHGYAAVAPQETPRQWTFSLRWENDTFAGSDRFYTDGVSLSLAHTGRSWLDPVMDRLPWGQGRRTVSYELGQIMVTPSDTSLPVPDPNDRPYAGLLFAGLSLHVERDHLYHGLKFITGVIGPWSLAEDTQQFVHDLVDSSRPQGWEYQLRNEPIFNLVYEHRRKYRLLGEAGGVSLEALPVANAMLGNVLIQGQAGAQLRVGYRIPDDFGTTLMRGMVHLPPPRSPRGAGGPQWGIYWFGGGNVNLVARDITLDGNTWRDSRSVDKEWFVPAAEVGMAVYWRRFQAAFTYVFWGKEFKGQQNYSEFGALTLSYTF